MRQFDVFRNPSAASASFAPFIVLLQSHHLLVVETLIVAPLILPDGKPVSLLDIPILFQEQPLFIAMAELANIPQGRLGPSLGNLADSEYAIRRALDRLFTGF